MKQKDLVWVNVPFSNLEEDKIRPALIVSNNSYNLNNLDVVVCAITSNLKNRPYSVPIEKNDLVGGSLPIPSRIKADKIMQVEKSRIIKPFARLDDKIFGVVVNEIVKLLGD